MRTLFGCSEKEIREEISLARVYAAFHTAQVQMGHEVQYPAVIVARREMATQWMQETLSAAKTAPIEGVLNLD